MKTAIVYYSKHHGNTKKLLDAIAKQSNVELIDASSRTSANLSEYDLIGFASGIYYQKYQEAVLKFAEKNLPHGKKVFLIYTYGMKGNTHADAIKQITDSKGAQMLGTYSCPGYDTFGPLKLIGGIAKDRPNDEDISGAFNFFMEITKDIGG